jgi:hypothetical protein
MLVPLWYQVLSPPLVNVVPEQFCVKCREEATTVPISTQENQLLTETKVMKKLHVCSRTTTADLA